MPSNNSFDESRFVALLEDAISKVKTEEDPIVLTEIKSILMFVWFFFTELSKH